MSTMLIAFNGTTAMGQYLGDTLVSIKTAWLFAQNHPCEKIILALSPTGELNFLWDRFVNHYGVQVVYDSFHPGNMSERFGTWDAWRKTRQIDGLKFDVYKELHRRIDGGLRQTELCGKEAGLGRKNIFEYLYCGQEDVRWPALHTEEFGSELVYHPVQPALYDVLVAPDAKCQGNGVFTHDFWKDVVRRLLDAGLRVTVNRKDEFLPEITDPAYRKIYPDFKGLRDEVCRHRLVLCGNTGVGWMAAACGIPLLAMQHDESNMQDYRYEWCGVKSLVDFVREPDAPLVAQMAAKFSSTKIVLTTGCFDLMHAGHVRHLQESKCMGDFLVVALNSDVSARKLKGEGRPIRSQQDREQVLRAMRCVDDVRVFDGDNATELIHELRPHFLTNGSDHKQEEVVGREFVESYGGQVIITGGERTVSTTKIVNRITGADVLKAVKDGALLSPNPEKKLRLLAEQVVSVESLKGALADVGTFRGGSALVMRRLSPSKVLHCFDTWIGNPHADPLCHHGVGEWKADRHECERLVGPELTTFHQGVFPASAAGLEDERFSLAYLDVDTYQGTKDALEWLWPRMVEGGKVVLDDWNWKPCAGVQAAAEEFFKPEQLQLFPEQNTAVVTK